MLLHQSRRLGGQDEVLLSQSRRLGGLLSHSRRLVSEDVVLLRQSRRLEGLNASNACPECRNPESVFQQTDSI